MNNAVRDLGEEDRRYIESIKLAAGSVQYKKMSVQKVFVQSIGFLYSSAKCFDNKKYLETAWLQIQAYLEMGFSYDAQKELFDQVLGQLDINSKEFVLTHEKRKAEKICLNRQSVRSMIKKWPASPKQDMKIEDVVTDIIKKVSGRKQGIYYYDNAVTGEVYELVINCEDIFFRDLQRGRFFMFDLP